MPAVIIIQTRISVNNQGEVDKLLGFFRDTEFTVNADRHMDVDVCAVLKDFRDSPPRVTTTVMEEKL